VLALDLVLPMLQRTQQQCDTGDRLQLLCADAQALPLHDNSMDLIVSSLTVQWCRDVGKMFSEMHRVLRPGGRILLSTLGPQTLQELRAAWSQVDAKHLANSFVTRAGLMNAANAAGLRGDATTDMKMRHYQSLHALAQELKGLGANAVASQTQPTAVSPAAFKAASTAFARGREANGIPVSWEIFYLQLHKPE
ncbi:MAG: methyltransferase domain-containing protein, partial [Pseudomonadota bacterium]